jgi:hypothetical protein
MILITMEIKHRRDLEVLGFFVDYKYPSELSPT